MCHHLRILLINHLRYSLRHPFHILVILLLPIVAWVFFSFFVLYSLTLGRYLLLSSIIGRLLYLPLFLLLRTANRRKIVGSYVSALLVRNESYLLPSKLDFIRILHSYLRKYLIYLRSLDLKQWFNISWVKLSLFLFYGPMTQPGTNSSSPVCSLACFL